MAIVTKGSGGSIKLSGTGGSLKIIAAGSGGINPGSLPGLVAWFKADSLGLSNGATVTSWADSSPSGNHLNYYEGSPIYNASNPLLNGMPSVTYDGNSINEKLNPVNLPQGSAASTTYVVGYRDPSLTGGNMFSWGSDPFSAGRRMSLGYYSNMIFNIGTYSAGSWPVAGNSPFIATYTYTAGSTLSASPSYYNGSIVTGGDGQVPNVGNGGIRIGGIATYWLPYEKWKGAVAEVIVYDNTHDSATRQSVENYLSNKYGITI